MIRVGFTLAPADKSWIGGLNYLSNLLHAVARVPQRRIEPVLIVPPGTPQDALKAFPAWEVLETPLADPGDRRWQLARKLFARAAGCDVPMQRYLRAHRIDLLSHSDQLGSRASVPTIGWIADFQHRRMPEFFGAGEIAARERGYRRIARHCTTVLLSSSDAQRDLAAFDASAVARSRVLRFVAGFAGGATQATDEATLRARYAIAGPYFHLPNQFWAHKNHALVIDAMAAMKAQGLQAQVVCTGHTQDRRQPGHFDALMRRAAAAGVAEREFRVLGLVPYDDLAGLMQHAAALINPSLFEGWSTTVEEAKSLGLAIVLSDIPVHREQAPERGVYFDPGSARSLAAALAPLCAGTDREAQARHRERARSQLALRFAEFGSRYQEIVLETCERARGGAASAAEGRPAQSAPGSRVSR